MRKPKRANYIGRQFGEILVVSNSVPSNGTNRGGIWNCKCSCGVEFELIGYKLHSRKSCGHLAAETSKATGAKNRRPERVTITNQYRQHRENATSRGFSYLPKEDWYEIVKKPCYYCGDIDIRNAVTAPHYKKRCYSLTEEIKKTYAVEINGIDRLNSNIGYKKENVVPCCAMCNRMKMEYNINDFLSKIKLIYKRLIACNEFKN